LFHGFSIGDFAELSIYYLVRICRPASAAGNNHEVVLTNIETANFILFHLADVYRQWLDEFLARWTIM
jgi:hypothetical protein